jgi:MFS family permease
MNTDLTLIIMIGLVDLFADMTYEGGRSITGQFLGSLGASGNTVTLIMGVSEFLGYMLRWGAGIITDRTRKYRILIIIGYLLNVVVFPLFSVFSSTTTIMLLIMLERCGRALRIPARDVVVSHAALSVGVGFGMSLREFFDQLGAILGPVLVAVAWYISHNYRVSLFLLALPAVITMFLVYKAISSPAIRRFEQQSQKYILVSRVHFSVAWWWFLAAVISLGIATIDFQLLAYHMQHQGIMNTGSLAVLYGCAMAITAVGTLIMGKLFDRYGPYSMIAILALVSGYAPLALYGGFVTCIVGVMLWSILYSCHGSLLAALVTKLVVVEARATAYGISGAALGIGWLLGSLLRGFLYGYSLAAMVIVTVLFHGIAVILFSNSFRHMHQAL